ncbi:cell division protein FtsX [Nitratidesulfovibrio sp. D1]|uniref:cell division protein FtsX n=1 Tax=Nitratidesulfovibrio sp. D1 TaxID=3440151 RepID=UPI003EC0625B
MRTFFRLLGRGVADLFLHPWAQLLSMAAVTLVVFLSGLFLMALATVDAELSASRGETVYQVYWRPGTDMAHVRGQWEELRHLPWLASLETYSPDEALDALARRMGETGAAGGPDIGFLSGKSPLPPTALLTFAPREAEPEKWAADTLAYLKALSGVERVAASPLRDELGKAWRSASRFVIWPTVGFLGVVLALVVGNTVRLTLSTRREEIEILQLVGARNWYIRLPLVVAGALQGLLGGGLACLLLLLMHWRFRTALNVPPLLLELRLPPPEQAVLLLAVPVLMGILGSWIAVRSR